MSLRLLDPDWLRTALADRTAPEDIAWLEEAVESVEEDSVRIRVLFPMASRMAGRDVLDEDAEHDDLHAWRVDDAARTLLLVALGEGVEAELDDLYRYGDAAERRGLLRALPFLPIGTGGVALVEDAIRSNDTTLIAAALGPYATAHLDDAAYEQAVLKCVFVGVPIEHLDGIPERVTPNGARMLAAFVHERVAAGRDVPAEVWTVIDRHPPADELRAIESELESSFDDRRRAAERALAARSSLSAGAPSGGPA